jgi:hypothetical protein
VGYDGEEALSFVDAEVRQSQVLDERSMNYHLIAMNEQHVLCFHNIFSKQGVGLSLHFWILK